MLISVVAAIPAEAQQYAARRNGDIVQLEDQNNQIVVSIITSVGMIAYEMKVKGQDVLRGPASIDEFRAKPAGLPGIPLLAPWANRLDEQAFYANGKRYPFDMELGNVNGAIPIHGFMTRTDQWQVVEAKADGKAAWVTSRLDAYKQPAWMKQWPFAHTMDVTYRLQDGTLEVLTKVTNHATEPMPVSLGWHPYYQLTDSPREEWTVDDSRAHVVDARLPQSPDRRHRAGREDLSRRQGRAEGLQPGRRVQRSHARCAGARDGRGEGTQAAARDQPGTELQVARHLLPESVEHRPWQPGRAAESECAAGATTGAARGGGGGRGRGNAPASPPNFICFEPMAGITNAMNLAHKGGYKELQYIKPGGTWQESFWIKPSGF